MKRKFGSIVWANLMKVILAEEMGRSLISCSNWMENITCPETNLTVTTVCAVSVTFIHHVQDGGFVTIRQEDGEEIHAKCQRFLTMTDSILSHPKKMLIFVIHQLVHRGGTQKNSFFKALRRTGAMTASGGSSMLLPLILMMKLRMDGIVVRNTNWLKQTKSME